MLNDSIRAVKEAEKEAEQILAKAGVRANELLRETREEAEKLRSEALELAQADARDSMARAVEKGKAILEDPGLEDSAEKKAQEELLASRKKEAVDAVISLILS